MPHGKADVEVGEGKAERGAKGQENRKGEQKVTPKPEMWKTDLPSIVLQQ